MKESQFSPANISLKDSVMTGDIIFNQNNIEDIKKAVIAAIESSGLSNNPERKVLNKEEVAKTDYILSSSEKLSMLGVDIDPDVELKLGHIASTAGKTDLAEKHYNRALKIWERRRHNLGITAAAGSLGNILKTRGDYVGAKKFHRIALKIAKKGSHHNQISGCLGNLSQIELSLGNISRSLRLAKKALGEARKVYWDHSKRDYLVSYSQIGIGSIYIKKNKLSKAERYIKHGLATCSRNSNKNGEGYALTMLGEIELLRGNLKKSEDYYQESLTLSRHFGYLPIEVESLLGLAKIRLREGDYKLSEKIASESLAISQFIDSFELMEESSKLIGDIRTHV